MKVLIVEDCPDDAELLCAELAQGGEALIWKRVECEEDMREALAAEDWDIVISDHTMPCFSSAAALDTLKASGKDIPFIIYSGDISEQTAVSAMRDGAHDFVRKGQAARLLPLVEREVRNAQMRSAKKAAESRLYRLAHFDKLTGLPNRELFCEEAARIVQQAADAAGSFPVCLLSLDRFGEVNHAEGFEAGDAIIRQVAERLKTRVGTAGIVARLGGDHFAILAGRLHGTSAVRHFADSLTGCFKTPFLATGREVYLTCSLGIALCPDHGCDVSLLLVNAEAAAAVAKRVSGNSYRCYEPQLAETAARRVGLETALRHAVDRNELVLHYQPLVALATERVVGAEALVRWRHPEYGLLVPDTFIPIADETGLIVDIGGAVLAQACRQVKAWHDLGRTDMRMAINVSPAQFDGKTLLPHVDAALRDSGIDPCALEIEITESVLMRDIAGTAAILRALKDRGIAISIDDFGTGYSSLSYLRRFPIDTLKIDRSFVREVVSSPDDHAIVSAIVSLARSLRLCIVAEGVESEAQAELLRREHVDFAQGHYYGKAVPAANFEAHFRGSSSPRLIDFLYAVTG